jgi:hypothetical protein
LTDSGRMGYALTQMVTPPVPAELDPPLWISTPPYAVVEPVPGVPPLGSIFILDVDLGTGAIRGVSGTVRRAPWAPLLVVTRASPADPEVLRELEGVPGSPAFLVRRPDEGIPLGSLARQAVCSRRPIDPEQLAAYIASRLRRPSIAMPMTIAMSAPTRGLARVAFGVRWLAGRLNSLGDLDASEWRDVFHLAAGAGNLRLSSAQAAERMGLDLWTLRRRLERLAGATLDQYREYAGWEWFVESVLRVHCGVLPREGESQAPLPGRQGHLKSGD